MTRAAVGGAVASVSVPVFWDFFGYQFQAGPLVVAICATLLTRLVVSLNAPVGKRRWLLDVLVTLLAVLVSALWVQANDLGLLAAGLTGISFGALGIGIIGLAKSQAAVAFRAALQTFLRGVAAPPPAVPKRDPDADLLDKLE